MTYVNAHVFSPLTDWIKSQHSGSASVQLPMLLLAMAIFFLEVLWECFWRQPKNFPSMPREASRSCFFIQQMWHAIKQTPIMFCNEIVFVLQLVTCVRAVPGLLFTHIVLQWCALYHIWASGFLNQHFAKRVTITSATHKIHPCIICHSVMFYNENQLVHTVTARTQNETG